MFTFLTNISLLLLCHQKVWEVLIHNHRNTFCPSATASSQNYAQFMHPEQDQIWQFRWSSEIEGGSFWRSEEIEEGHFGEVRRLRGVILVK